MSFEHVIAAPVERVWKVVTDIDGYVDRLTKVEAAVRLTDGPFGVGTQYRETRVVYGHPVTVENWITECDILRRYVIQANVDALAITEFMFTPTPD